MSIPDQPHTFVVVVFSKILYFSRLEATGNCITHMSKTTFNSFNFPTLEQEIFFHQHKNNIPTSPKPIIFLGLYFPKQVEGKRSFQCCPRNSCRRLFCRHSKMNKTFIQDYSVTSWRQKHVKTDQVLGKKKKNPKKSLSSLPILQWTVFFPKEDQRHFFKKQC